MSGILTPDEQDLKDKQREIFIKILLINRPKPIILRTPIDNNVSSLVPLMNLLIPHEETPQISFVPKISKLSEFDIFNHSMAKNLNRNEIKRLYLNYSAMIYKN